MADGVDLSIEKRATHKSFEAVAREWSSTHAVASPLLTEDFDGEERISMATYFYPVGNKTLACQAFALHLALTMNLVEQMAINYLKFHPEDGFRPLAAARSCARLCREVCRGDATIRQEASFTTPRLSLQLPRSAGG